MWLWHAPEQSLFDNLCHRLNFLRWVMNIYSLLVSLSWYNISLNFPRWRFILSFFPWGSFSPFSCQHSLQLWPFRCASRLDQSSLEFGQKPRTLLKSKLDPLLISTANAMVSGLGYWGCSSVAQVKYQKYLFAAVLWFLYPRTKSLFWKKTIVN